MKLKVGEEPTYHVRTGATTLIVPAIIAAYHHDRLRDCRSSSWLYTFTDQCARTLFSIYRHSCEELLSPLMLPDNKFHELLENSEGNAWEDAELGESLCE
jgi:hypothetical protein